MRANVKGAPWFTLIVIGIVAFVGWLAVMVHEQLATERAYCAALLRHASTGHDSLEVLLRRPECSP